MVISPNNTNTPAYYQVSGLENASINSDQLRSLLYLYAPIIGSVGVFLYQLL